MTAGRLEDGDGVCVLGQGEGRAVLLPTVGRQQVRVRPKMEAP